MSVLDDPKFHALPREEQKRQLAAVSQKFAALAPEKQDEFLSSRAPAGYTASEPGVARSFAGGMQSGMSYLERAVANLGELVQKPVSVVSEDAANGVARLTQHVRDRSKMLERLSQGGAPETIPQKVAYAAGAIPPAVLGFLGPTKFLGPVAGSAAYEALAAATPEAGADEIAEAGGRGAVLGGVLGAGEAIPNALARAGAVTAGSGAVSAASQAVQGEPINPVDLMIEAGSMGVLSLLGGRGHAKVRKELDLRAAPPEPVRVESPVPEPPTGEAPPRPPVEVPSEPPPVVTAPETPPPEAPQPTALRPRTDPEMTASAGLRDIMNEKWKGAGDPPFVDTGTLAKKLGLSGKETTAILAGLEEAGYVEGVLPTPKHKFKVFRLKEWQAPAGTEAPPVVPAAPPPVEAPPANAAARARMAAAQRAYDQHKNRYGYEPKKPRKQTGGETAEDFKKRVEQWQKFDTERTAVLEELRAARAELEATPVETPADDGPMTETELKPAVEGRKRAEGTDEWGLPKDHTYSEFPWHERAEAAAERMPDEQRRGYEKERKDLETWSDAKLAEWQKRKLGRPTKASIEAEIETRNATRGDARAEASELQKPVSLEEAKSLLGKHYRDEAPTVEAEAPESIERAKTVDRQGPPGLTNKAALDVTALPPNAPVPKKLANAAEAVVRVAKALEATVQSGTLRNLNRERGVLGYARTNLGGFMKPTTLERFRSLATRSIRVRKWGDFQTKFHELAHYEDSTHPDLARWFDPRWNIGGPSMGPWTKAQEEMLMLSYDVTKPHEGYAEFRRYWFSDRQHLVDHASTALAEFEKLAPQVFGPKVWKIMNEAREEVHRYFAQGALRSMDTIIGKPSPDAGQMFADKKLLEQRAYWFDDYAEIAAAEKSVNGEQAPDKAYAQFRLLRQIQDLQTMLWQKGMPVFDEATGHIKAVGKSYEKILLQVSTSAMELENFKKYGIARMARELRKQGRENLVTPGMEAAAMALETPKFKAVFEELMAAKRTVAEFGRDMGLYNDEQMSQWQREEYAWGFFRSFDAQTKGRPLAGPLEQASGIHRLKGSSRNLRDPIDAILYGDMRIIQLAMEGRAKRSLDENVFQKPGGGRFAEPLPKTMVEQVASREAVLNGIRAAIKAESGPQALALWAPYINAMSNDMAGLISQFVSAPPKGNRIMEYRVGGKTKYVEIFDDKLIAAIQAMRRGGVDSWVKWLGEMPRRLIHTAVTLDPGFMLAQLIRDPAMATMLTRTGWQSITASARGYMEAIRRGPEYWDALANLSGVSLENPHLSPKVRQAELIAKAQRQSGNPVGYLKLMNPLELKRYLEALGRIIEAGPRLGERIRSKEKGESAVAASYRSREITTDFSMQGRGDMAVWLSHTVPFYRAMMASADRMYRGGFKDPTFKARTAARVGTFAVMSMLYHAWASEQDWYKKISPWARWNSFIMPPVEINGEMVHARIPKMYEFGMIANVGERMYDELMADPKDKDKIGLAKDILKIAQINFGVGLPWLAEAYTEGAANRVSHTGAPIEGISEQSLLPGYRTGPGVPRAIEALGRAEIKLGIPSEFQFSPAMGTHYIRSLFGNWSKVGFLLADASLYPGQTPSLHPDDLPIASRFFMREGKYSDASQDFYDTMQVLEQASATHREAFKRDDEEMAATLEEVPATYGGRMARRMTRAVADLRSQLKLIERDHTLTPEQKRMQMDIIRQELDVLMREGTEEGRALIRGE